MNSFKFQQSFRWYGPTDSVSLEHISQAGCSHVVTALHHIDNGEIWSKNEISLRRKQVERAGLQWEVVESLPVHEDIKRQRGSFEIYLANFRQSIENLSKEGIKVITYNFMPVLDWTRTDLAFPLKHGGLALRFDYVDYAAFDLFILKRLDATYSEEIFMLAEQRFKSASPEELATLESSILAGLPGSEAHFDRGGFQAMLDAYRGIDEAGLRQNLLLFLERVIPTAQSCGVKLALHPDDPPFSLFGLPRIASTYRDLETIFTRVPAPENGFCFCSGSLGVSAENDLEAIINLTADRIHFAHLRNVQRENLGSFHEAEHLEGSSAMDAIVTQLMRIMQERRFDLPIRPDHGHAILDDLEKLTNPGYTAIGRLKGLAELRGLERGIAYALKLSQGKAL